MTNDMQHRSPRTRSHRASVVLLGSFRAISGDEETLAALEVFMAAPPGRWAEVGRHEDRAFQTWLRRHNEYGSE